MCLYIWAYFGHHPPFEVHVPESLATLMGYIAEYVAWATGGPFTLSSESVKDACITRYANGALAERLLGYTPRVGLEEGLRRGCEDYARRLAKMGAKGEMSRNVKAPEVFLK
jgi:sterol-4alpha-carboxylate 3-dehydrogenase (decarboxylating)